MTNSVDPDQTPDSAASDLGLHCFAQRRPIRVYTVCAGLSMRIFMKRVHWAGVFSMLFFIFFQ